MRRGTYWVLRLLTRQEKTMTRDEILQLLYDGIVEDMTFLYKNAGLEEKDIQAHLDQGTQSFQLICTNTLTRLIEKGVING